MLGVSRKIKFLLEDFKKKQVTNLFLKFGIPGFFLTILILLLSSFSIDLFQKEIILIINIFAGLLFIVFSIFCAIKYFFPVNSIKIAKKIEMSNPEFGVKIITYLNLLNENVGSADFKIMALEQLEQEIIARKPDSKIQITFGNKIVLLLSILIIGTLYFKFENLQKIFFEKPWKLNYSLIPGNHIIKKGENLRIQLQLNGASEVNSIFILFRNIKQSEWEKKRIYKGRNVYYNYVLKNITELTEYKFEIVDKFTKKYIITPELEPDIRSILIRIKNPVYSRIPVYEQKDDGNINILKGAYVEFEVETTKKIKTAYIEKLNNKGESLKGNGSVFRGGFTIKNDLEYSIQLEDFNKFTNQNPVVYTIRLLEDNYPEIELNNVKEEIKIENKEISNEINILDDYGFSGLELYYKLIESKYDSVWTKYKRLEIKIKEDELNQKIIHRLPIETLRLIEGDRIEYFYKIKDNDAVSGLKESKTKLLYLKMPTLSEILGRNEKQVDNLENTFEKIAEETEKTKNEIDKLQEQLKTKENSITWEQKEKLNETLEQFQNLENNINKLQNEVEKTINKSSGNISSEILEKLTSLKNILDEAIKDGKLDQLETLQANLKNLSKEQIQKSIENHNLTEDKIKAGIERTLKLLKKIKADIKLDKLVKQSDDLIQKGIDILDKPDNEKLINDQEEKIQEIKKDIDEFKNLSKEAGKNYTKAGDEISELFDKTNFNEHLKDLSEAKFNEKKNKQRKLNSDLNAFNSFLKKKKKELAKADKKKNNEILVKIIAGLLDISKEQEKLQEMMFENKNILNLQVSVKEQFSTITQNINELLGNIYLVLPEAGAYIKQTEKLYDELIKTSLISKETSNNYNIKIIGNINKIADIFIDNLRKNTSSASGGDAFSDEMESLGNEQISLNDLLQSLLEGGISGEEQNRIKQMVTNQNNIKKRLQELSENIENYGRDNDIKSQLEKINEEMEKIVREMEQGNYNEKIMRNQETILSKLLEAGKAEKKRNNEQEFYSEEGEDIIDKNSAHANDKKNGKINIDEIRGIFRKEYEDIIIKYLNKIKK